MSARGPRLAYSTLGCPGDSLERVITRCRAFGITGLELRCGPGEIVDPAAGLERSRHIGSILREEGLTILALCTRVRVCAKGDVPGEALPLFEHTRAVGATGMRVFPGGDADVDSSDARGSRTLAAIATEATRRGCRVLLETHDSHPRGADVARIIDRIPAPDRDEVGVIWDVLHPWRAGEEPADTAAALGGLLDYVQIKDWSSSAGLCLPGEGEVPLREIRSALGPAADDVWFSLEWEKAWEPDLPELDLALERARSWLA
ncbi:sugar phosphate isomerase/epimerase family protein [Ruania rhizosphaerae]|uniref:sugar phosphate isomerase/epimerase family protein n=1 Tax=Ruania rhizosphaerae TaxID=1840413 RepID=UPI00135AF9AC|nr:sugar phosphate isomerase/epimerase [Ruania rhizosphaerae]